MKVKPIIFGLIIIPFTLVLDLILFAFSKNCPTCGSYNQFITHEGALSFPYVVLLLEWFHQSLFQIRKRQL